MDRPDLTNVNPEIKAYIEYLEARLKSASPLISSQKKRESGPEPEIDVISTAPLQAEAPTSIQIISVSSTGMVKRTSRHLYTPQHRGGVGIYDIELKDPDFPSVLASVDESQNLLLFTNLARAFRYPIGKIQSTPVHGKGDLFERLPFEQDEKVVSILPEQAQGYVAMVSAGGRVRTLRHHVFGEHMKPGTSLYPYRDFGPLVSACWTPGDGDLFIATRRGIGIRFNEKLISPQGDYGIKVGAEDTVVGITPVRDDSGVLMVTSDGKGTIRLMSGFAPNKTPGGSGKIAIKSEHLINAVSVEESDNIFIITRLGKMIRFKADEVPQTEGVVQGVNCILMRSDVVTSVLKSS